MCEGVFPRLTELANEYAIDLVKIDMNNNKYIPGQLSVFILPTLLVIYRGKEMLRESRFIDFDKIKSTLNYIQDMEELD